MSRSADAASQKKDQKAAMSAKKDRKAELLAMGLTSTMKKLIGDDKLLCTACGATAMGPTKCECKGGVSRPGPDFEDMPQLIDAAKARGDTEKVEQQKVNLQKQAEISQERGKRKEARGELDLHTEYDEVDGVELRQMFEFPVGKLGMDIERNIVTKVDAGGSAADLGIKCGWVITEVNRDPVPAEKKAIISAISKVFKNERKPCSIRFRCPLAENDTWFCFRCEKFLETGAFDAEMEGKSHAQRGCSSCEECADMFGDEDDE